MIVGTRSDPRFPRLIPKDVRERIEYLEGNTGEQVEFAEPEPGTFFIRLANDRIEVTITYQFSAKIGFDGRRRWKETGYETKLYVDGQERKPVSTPAAFIELWRDPDGFVDPKVEGWKPEPLPESLPVDSAPMVVQRLYRKIVDRLGALEAQDEATLSVWEEEGERWLVGAIASESIVITFLFTNTNGTWRLDSDHGMSVIVDGDDVSDQFGGSVDRMLSVLTMKTKPKPSGQGPVSRGSTLTPRSRSNSVEVRNTVVYRD